MLFPFAVGQLVFAPLSASQVKRYGAKAVSAAGLLLTAIALAAFIFIGAQTPAWIVALAFFVQGSGMANIMPPAMESIMSSLPRERAGVASAVSNTMRQVGGALGIAVLGSVLAGVYRQQIAPATQGLPAPARTVANESISGAYGVAARLGPAAHALTSAANDAFMVAMHWAAGLSTLIAVLGVLVVLRWMPGRPVAATAAQEPASEPELAPVSSGRNND
jgi:MFS family permease